MRSATSPANLTDRSGKFAGDVAERIAARRAQRLGAEPYAGAEKRIPAACMGKTDDESHHHRRTLAAGGRESVGAGRKRAVAGDPQSPAQLLGQIRFTSERQSAGLLAGRRTLGFQLLGQRPSAAAQWALGYVRQGPVA